MIATFAAAAALTVGTRTLVPCSPAISGYCGHLDVPLNWQAPAEGTLSIRFEWVPARSGHAVGTIVAQEGGPGYATTGTGTSYRLLFAPLMNDHNLLMMDERGTGASSPIDCAPLQHYRGSTAVEEYRLVAALCGAQLDTTFRRANGTYVHASDLFGTSASVRDLHAVLGALATGPVDLYGDSYGSFFAQVFAARYPASLRSLVLDSTYPAVAQEPFDPQQQGEIRFAFDAVCRRSVACAAAGGTPLDRIADLAKRLDAAPLVADTRLPDGTKVAVRAGAGELESLLTAGAYDFGPYRNLDAAARAWLDRGDVAPLARLFAWTINGPAYLLYPFTEFSNGMALADSCTVYANPFALSASFAERRAQYAARVAALPPFFAFPVTNAEAVSAPTEYYDECFAWPRPLHDDPLVTHGLPLVPPTLPVLIISGDLDSTTSPGDAMRVAQQIGPSVRFITIPNSDHTPALGDNGALQDVNRCASAIVRAFVQRPFTAPDASCAARIPEIRSVGIFPTVLADQPPAAPLSGNTATPDELRLAAVAVGALGDTLNGATYLVQSAKTNCDGGFCGVGLRGGSYRSTLRLDAVSLDRVVYASGTTVSGSVVRTDAFAPLAPGVVSAHLRASGPNALAAGVDVHFDQRSPHAIATLAGTTAAGHRIRATVAAP